VSPFPARAAGGAHGDLHRRDRFAGPAARRWRAGRAGGDGTGGEHHPGRDGRAGGGERNRGDRRHQSPDAAGPRAAAPGALRRDGVHPGARPRRAAEDPGHPHQRDAHRRRRGPGHAGGAHAGLHGRGPGRPGAPRGASRAAREPGRSRRADEVLRDGAQGKPRVGHAGDGKGVRGDRRATEARKPARAQAHRLHERRGAGGVRQPV
ncbi:MAG: AAA family ATPase Cdc48, partial [uncultured Gemmatimonadetes bacterium]